MPKENIVTEILHRVPPTRGLVEQARHSLLALSPERISELRAQIALTEDVATRIRQERGVSLEASRTARRRAAEQLLMAQGGSGPASAEATNIDFSAPVSAMLAPFSAAIRAAAPNQLNKNPEFTNIEPEIINNSISRISESVIFQLISEITKIDSIASGASGILEKTNNNNKLNEYMRGVAKTPEVEQFIVKNVADMFVGLCKMSLDHVAMKHTSGVSDVWRTFGRPQSAFLKNTTLEPPSFVPDYMIQRPDLLSNTRSIESLALICSRVKSFNADAIVCLDLGGEIISKVIGRENNIEKSKFFVIDRSDDRNWRVNSLASKNSHIPINDLRDAERVVIVDDIARSGVALERSVDVVSRLNPNAVLTGMVVVASSEARQRLDGNTFYTPNITNAPDVRLPWDNSSGDNFRKTRTSYHLGAGSRSLNIPVGTLHSMTEYFES